MNRGIYSWQQKFISDSMVMCIVLKKITQAFFVGGLLFSLPGLAQTNRLADVEGVDKVQALKDSLSVLALRPGNELFQKSCSWFLQVLETREFLTAHDSAVLGNTYDSFCIERALANRRDFASCLQREFPLLIAWTSPTDGQLSFAALRLPAYWDPEIAYPLYIHLHGLASDTDEPIDFLCRYFLKAPNQSTAYEDGYLVFPWGRGNLWYQGVSEADILECRNAVQQLFEINLQRQYILGHSMGGYGAWYIASRHPNLWAAVGLEAAALWYGNVSTLADETIQQLKEIPTYFVVGVQDGLFDVNLQAYNLLNEAGNEHTSFNSFNGGHEHLDINEELMYLWLQDFVNEDYTYLSEPRYPKPLALDVSPNPCTSSLHLSFGLDEPSMAILSLYNLQGQRLETILHSFLPDGIKELDYKTTNLVSGVYLLCLQVNGSEYARELLLKIE
ncbi:MAG: alpha/beta hydrolase-fold protein [Bacteroidales bacterium]